MYGYAPGATKIIKSRTIPNIDLKEVDDESTRFPVDTKILKVFNDLKYQRSSIGYDYNNLSKGPIPSGIKKSIF